MVSNIALVTSFFNTNVTFSKKKTIGYCLLESYSDIDYFLYTGDFSIKIIYLIEKWKEFKKYFHQKCEAASICSVEKPS